MHQMGHITDRMLWAGERFARGWAVASGGSSSAAGRDFDPWSPRGGIAIPEQLRAAQAMAGIGADYQAACAAMDIADTRPAGPHGTPRRVTAKGTIRRVVTAIACEERSCGEVDRQAAKAPGWAGKLLKEGLRIYVEMFGGNFKREVPGYLRGVG